MENVLYAYLTPPEFLERIKKAPIAYLPLGTLEWHGAHLPLGSDGLQSQGFFIELAHIAGGIVLPMLFVGPDRTEHKDDNWYYGMDILGFPDGSPGKLAGSAYHINTDLFESLLESVLAQLSRAGFKIVVGHGHGPSTNLFKSHADKWGAQFGLKLLNCWREDVKEDDYGIQTDHAGANETSLVMAFHPELVKMQNLDPNPDVRPLAVMGNDPRTAASAELGRKAVDMQLARMSEILKKELLSLNNK